VDVLTGLLEVLAERLRLFHFRARAPFVLDHVRADLQAGPDRQRARFGEALALDERAVRRLLVDDDDLVEREANLAMRARDLHVVEDPVGRFGAADDDRLVREANSLARLVARHHREVVRAIGVARHAREDGAPEDRGVVAHLSRTHGSIIARYPGFAQGPPFGTMAK
jgi:hypothetical protein